MDHTQEQQWIAQARQGNQEAFEQLVHLYEKRIYVLALRMCGSPEDAAEAAQEAFLAAWQGLPFFRGEASFSTWLYRLASNACVDLLRREGRHRQTAGPSLDDEETSLSVPDTGPGPQEATERRELREQINLPVIVVSAKTAVQTKVEVNRNECSFRFYPRHCALGDSGDPAGDFCSQSRRKG